MVVQNHENFDGSGYPYELKGEEICLEARIIRVVDTFDSLVSHRPCRPGMGKEKALEILEEGKETAFDPLLVDSFIPILQTDQGPRDKYAH